MKMVKGIVLPKHCEYSSRRTGQIPVSRAWVCCSLVSSISCKLITSWRVAGVLDTDCCHNWPSSSQQRGGNIEFRISSVSLLVSSKAPAVWGLFISISVSGAPLSCPGASPPAPGCCSAPGSGIDPRLLYPAPPFCWYYFNFSIPISKNIYIFNLYLCNSGIQQVCSPLLMIRKSEMPVVRKFQGCEFVILPAPSSNHAQLGNGFCFCLQTCKYQQVYKYAVQ